MADKYIYAVARIRALEMTLMSQAVIEQLVATDSYKKAVQFIIEKGWGDSDKASMDENDILRAETDKTWAAVAEMVDDMSVFDVIRLPDLYHNLKAAIKTVVAGETPAHVFFDNAEIDGQKMLSIVSDKAWDRLPEHMRDCAREAWDCMAQAGDGQMCDAVIDRGTLLAIMQAAKKADDSLLRDYAETTVAVADIKIAVRSMKTGKNKDFMKRAMAECADPAECKTIADLGVDMLAAGIGNIHGKYPANWKGLSFETLDAIQQKTGVMPLVLHGGTGIPADMIKKAISLGVSKINVNTECQLSFADATRKYIEAGKDLEGKGFDPRKLLAPGFEAIKATVKEKMELFGSVGKAND
jgi:hypothetical protein